MSIFVKIVSGVYLAFVWLVFFVMMQTVPEAAIGPASMPVLAFLVAVTLSIPAAALFAFGQVVGDVRIMRNHARRQSEHLKSMRASYAAMLGGGDAKVQPLHFRPSQPLSRGEPAFDDSSDVRGA